MDTKFRSLSLVETPEAMDLDSPRLTNRDTDGDVIMDESISNSPSLPLRYHNYFHRIKKVNQTKRSSRELNSLEDMRSRIQEIDQSIEKLNAQEESHKTSFNTSSSSSSVPTQADKIIDPTQVVGNEQRSDEQDEVKPTNVTESQSTGKSLIRSMMSPTALGARVAYNASPASSPVKLADENEILEYSTTDAVVENENGELVNRTPKQVQFQLHHHHYYYPVNQGLSQNGNMKLSHGEEDGAETYQQTQELQNYNSNGEVYLPHASKSHDTPYYISTYLQMTLNFMATSYAFYIGYQLITGMKSDIDLRLKEKIQDLLIEVEVCRENFEENKCFKDTITPVIRDQCAKWEKCMYKDPFSTSGKAVITAQLVGMIINSLIEPISIRSCFVLVMIVCCLFALNFSFGFLRAKIYYRAKGSS